MQSAEASGICRAHSAPCAFSFPVGATHRPPPTRLENPGLRPPQEHLVH